MIDVGIIGATGYTGVILVSILKNHKEVRSIRLGSKTYKREEFSSVFKNFKDIEDSLCYEINIKEFANTCDAVFIALPHGIASKEVTKEVLNKTKIIDLGADFRLSNTDIYEKWYGVPHYGKDILKESVYGLCEINNSEIKKARLVANPGCYTTCSILSLIPLIKHSVIDTNSIIIDAKSGVSGAGRGANIGSLFCECNESIKAYGITTHRHTPEIEQEVSKFSVNDIKLSFNPHLVPMNRGILTTIYASLKKDITESEIFDIYLNEYKDKKFIRIRKPKDYPGTNFVKGSNYFDLSFAVDERTNKIIIVSAIDNLMKGASSQAVQNMNIMFGFDESEGIDFIPQYL